jgi:predicted nucleic acid-binding protein
MFYFDSDVIFNAITLQDEVKNKESHELIIDALNNDLFVISTLVIQEVGYGLARYEIANSIIKDELEYWSALNVKTTQTPNLARALHLAQQIGFKHINDCIHTALAESLKCDRFYTYNKSDYKRIQKHTDLQIIIL